MKPINWLILFCIGMLPVVGLVWTFMSDPNLAPPSTAENVWKDPFTGIAFVQVPDNCTGAQQSCVAAFWISQTEVTNAQFQRYRNTHISRPYREQPLNEAPQPVAYVSWEDANAFTQWLTAQHQNKLRFRLPQAAEWRRACRANTTQPPWPTPKQACSHASVNDAISAATFGWTQPSHPCQDNFTVSAPVGTFPPNALEVHDMLGNVAEWTLEQDRAQASNEVRYVTRGGSWFSPPAEVSCEGGVAVSPLTADPRIGIRIVAEGIPTPESP